METPTSKQRRLFSLGRVRATHAALSTAVYYDIDMVELLKRHVSGDWSEMSDADQRENTFSIDKELRVFSSCGEGDAKLWVITEADRTATTILRPDEY